jgi:hypothetical protein
MSTANIALMCKSHNYYTKPNTDTITSPAWVLGKNRAKSLVGKTVVLTETKNSPAYLGGTITAVNLTATQKGHDGRSINRYDVVFTPSTNFDGNTDAINHSGWGKGRSVCFITE